MQIILLSKETPDYNRQASNILKRAFPHCYGDCAEDEISKCMESDRVAIGMTSGDTLLGFVGAIPQYGTTAWELHPLAVDENFRSQGIGRKLCDALEKVLKEKGCITLYLGCDDENESTTLSGCNIFEDTFNKIENIRNIKRHPYEFYRKIGYKIVGVIPDANGIGKPDIMMAKSLFYSVGE